MNTAIKKMPLPPNISGRNQLPSRDVVSTSALSVCFTMYANRIKSKRFTKRNSLVLKR